MHRKHGVAFLLNVTQVFVLFCVDCFVTEWVKVFPEKRKKVQSQIDGVITSKTEEKNLD